MALGKQISRILTVTPVIDSLIYGSGDQLGAIFEVPNAVGDSGSSGILQSISIVDGASQASILQVLLFDSRPTVVSADNAALNISDAEMAEKCIGVVSFVAVDYFALSANSIASRSNLGIIINSVRDVNNLKGTSLWCIIRCGGTPTYGSTSALTLNFGIIQD